MEINIINLVYYLENQMLLIHQVKEPEKWS